jgi:hypothetical protein
MNLLEALKQIAEKSDDKQHFMPDTGGEFPRGFFGDRTRKGTPSSNTLFQEMWRQTADAQRGPPESLLRDVRMNPEAIAAFIAGQPPSKNIDDRRGEIQPKNEPYSVDLPEDLQFDPNDPLAQILGINAIRPQSMAFDPVPLPRPRPRR